MNHNVNCNRVRIVSTGSYVPRNIVTNEELEARVSKTSAAWTEANLGVKERRVAAKDEFASDLAVAAARGALEKGGIGADTIDLIIVATATPDRKAPSTAAIVHRKLGLKSESAAFDIAAVCSGFVYGATIGAQFIQSGMFERVLVIGVDTFSKITDWTSRSCVFFGDGAGAVILDVNPSGDSLFIGQLYAAGYGVDSFTVYPHDATFTMDGRAVFETATRVLPEAISRTLAENGLTMNDVRHFFFHQASLRVLKETAARLGLPMSKLHTNMQTYANTAGATVPLLLDEIAASGQIGDGDLVVMATVGSGWTWGTILYRWQSLHQ